MPLDISWLALSLVRGIGHKTLNNLLEVFGTTDDILRASADDLVQVRGIGKKIAETITTIKLHELVLDIEQWQNAGVQIIPQYADNYPQILQSIDDAPLTLFTLGNYSPELWQNAVGIIGTRNPTKQAKKLAFELAEQLADSGRPIISGLALGVDASAHWGALQAKSAPTIAVLGGGVLNIYPAQNKKLAEKIRETGCLLSENAPNATASAPRLVTRNRIISALCRDIVVIQSDIKGGAMHAVKAGQQYGRTIHTVNWNFSGNQHLIKDGAFIIDPKNPHLASSM